MKHSNTLKIGALAAAVGFVISSGVMAGETSGTHTFTGEIEEFAVISLDTSTTPSITITAADVTAGAGAVGSMFSKETVADASTWSISTNGGDDGAKVSVGLNTALADATHTKLEVRMGAPAGAAGGDTYVDITSALTGSSDADVITAIDSVAESDLNIQYKLSGDVEADAVASFEKTVTFTITLL